MQMCNYKKSKIKKDFMFWKTGDDLLRHHSGIKMFLWTVPSPSAYIKNTKSPEGKYIYIQNYAKVSEKVKIQ